MTNVLSNVTGTNPKEIVYSGYGLLLYRACTSDFEYDSNYAVTGSSLSEGAPDVTCKGRVQKAGLNMTHTLNAAVWCFITAVLFIISQLVFMIIGMGSSVTGVDANAVLVAITSAINLTIGTALTLKVTTGSVTGKGYFKKADKLVSRAQLIVELDPSRKWKEGSPPATAMYLSPTIAESVRDLLALKVTDERDLVGKVTRKLQSDATEDEMYEWCRLAMIVFTHDPKFPAQYIPELSSDLAIVEQTVRVQMIAEKAEAAALEAVEDATRAKIGKQFEEVDSASSLAGAMAWLGMAWLGVSTEK